MILLKNNVPVTIRDEYVEKILEQFPDRFTRNGNHKAGDCNSKEALSKLSFEDLQKYAKEVGVKKVNFISKEKLIDAILSLTKGE